jgi:hypothetical protein
VQVLIPSLSKERLVELFVEDCEDRQLTVESIRHYRAVATAFLDYLASQNVSVFSANKFVLIEYLRKRRADGVDQKGNVKFTVDRIPCENPVDENPSRGAM